MKTIQDAIFRRAELLLGDEAMKQIAQKRVIIFGVGGVGSWCAESRVRSGVRRLTIVDSDHVCIGAMGSGTIALFCIANDLFTNACKT